MKKALLTSGLALAGLICAPNARATTMNFDGVPSGTAANSIAPAGWNFQFGVFAPDTDSFGDPITGTDHWQADPSAPDVLVGNPFLRVYGVAPSPSNALDGVDQTILLSFTSPQFISGFSTILDNSTFGNLGPQSIDFYDASNKLLYSLGIDETVPGFKADYNGSINGVSTIVFANNAFYDDVSVKVPDTSNSLALTIVGLGSLALTRRFVKVA